MLTPNQRARLAPILGMIEQASAALRAEDMTLEGAWQHVMDMRIATSALTGWEEMAKAGTLPEPEAPKPDPPINAACAPLVLSKPKRREAGADWPKPQWMPYHEEPDT